MVVDSLRTHHGAVARHGAVLEGELAQRGLYAIDVEHLTAAEALVGVGGHLVAATFYGLVADEVNLLEHHFGHVLTACHANAAAGAEDGVAGERQAGDELNLVGKSRQVGAAANLVEQSALQHVGDVVVGVSGSVGGQPVGGDVAAALALVQAAQVEHHAAVVFRGNGAEALLAQVFVASEGFHTVTRAWRQVAHNDLRGLIVALVECHLADQRVVGVLIDEQLLVVRRAGPLDACLGVDDVAAARRGKARRIVERRGGQRKVLGLQTTDGVGGTQADVVLLVVLQVVKAIERCVNRLFAGVGSVVGLNLDNILVGVGIVVPFHNHVGNLVVVQTVCDVVALVDDGAEQSSERRAVVVATAGEQSESRAYGCCEQHRFQYLFHVLKLLF